MSSSVAVTWSFIDPNMAFSYRSAQVSTTLPDRPDRMVTRADGTQGALAGRAVKFFSMFED